MVKRLIVVSILFSVSCGSKSLFCQEKNATNDRCLSYLYTYSRYWKLDSLGKNGFRELMSDVVLKECHFKGDKWTDIKKYLGKPNSRFSLNGHQYYRYRLNYQSKSIKDIGTRLVDFEVDNSGLIVGFSIFSVDG